MEPLELFFGRKVQMVLNFHSLKLVHQGGFNKKFHLRNFENAKKKHFFAKMTFSKR